MADFSVAIPYQFYNLIMVFVTILALLWGMVAIKRVYRMLRVRSAVLSDRMIQIRGLGSYLTYFDGATRMHLEAVVHTRQSMPPVVMDPLLVSAVSKGLSITGGVDRAKFSLCLSVHALQSTRVICLIDFKDGNFQRMVQQLKADSNDAVQSRIQLFHSLTGLRDNAVTGPSAALPRLQRGECCSFECLCAELGPGEHSLALPLLSIMNSWLGDRLVANGDDRVNIAVLLVPCAEPSRGGTPSKSAGSARTADSTAFALEEGDGENSEPGSPEEEPLHGAGSQTPVKARWGGAGAQPRSAGRNPMTTSATGRGGAHADASAPAGVFAAVFSHSFPLQSLRAASAAAAGGEWRVAATACDVMVLDGRCQLFQSQEVFGLAPVAPSSPQQAASPAPATLPAASAAPAPAASPSAAGAAAGTGAVGCGGCLVAEDCVVCLTMPKEVLLLPCRHLCVCESCLVFLDKCPVCRAAFEEYIAIRPQPAASAASGAAQTQSPGSGGGAAGLSHSASTGTALESIDATVLQI